MGHRLPALSLAAAVALALPAAAEGHSLVRAGGGELAYLSEDAVSLNQLTVKRVGSQIEFRDPTVDGGLDPGSCDPGDITSDANAWIISVRCPTAGVNRLRIDLGDREDGAEVSVELPVRLLGGPGADKVTTGAGADAVSGDDGDDVLAAGAGADQLNAGDGDDEVRAGAGNDVVQGGFGADVVDGEDGDDDLRVRDGVEDRVECGAGTDVVDADTLDVIGAGCERVTRSLTAPPPAGGTTGRDRTPPRVRVGGATLQRAGRGRLHLVATSSERGTISASGFLDVAGLSLPISAQRRPVTVGGGGVQLTVKLSARQLRECRRAWARGRRVVARLGVVATDRAGNSTPVRAPAVRLIR